MSMSPGRMAAIHSHDHANFVAHEAQTAANTFAIILIAEHMSREHNMSCQKIARTLGLKRERVRYILNEKQIGTFVEK